MCEWLPSWYTLKSNPVPNFASALSSNIKSSVLLSNVILAAAPLSVRSSLIVVIPVTSTLAAVKLVVNATGAARRVAARVVPSNVRPALSCNSPEPPA